MTVETSTLLADLEQRCAALRDLDHLGAILGWDQEVLMPAASAESRAHSLATLARLTHERSVDPALIGVIGELRARSTELEPEQRRLVELAWRRVRPASQIPAELAAEFALTRARALEAWRAARQASDFPAFRPWLEQLVQLSRRIAEATREQGGLYDALLDTYEPGARSAEVLPLLEQLALSSAPLLERVRDAEQPVRTKVARRRYDVPEQQAFVLEVLGKMGFDFERGRLDRSTHPFCGGNGPTDVRMTTRYAEKDLRVGLYGAIHEAGHGLYEQGLDPARARSILGGAVSMAIHESQSRLWENLVGRSRAFWKFWWKPLKRRFPAATHGYKAEDMWRAVNAIEPSFIRVEADELTYNLHILLRTRLEERLISGSLEVADLPAAWNQGHRELLGLEVPDDAQGCLQDIHWSMGSFGYFPTYSLGNLYAAQLMEAARDQLGDLDAAFAAGEFLPLRRWLQREIHRHDQLETPAELIQRITGRPLDAAAWERSMTHKVAALLA
jgi:carboxypeptidase Taq